MFKTKRQKEILQVVLTITGLVGFVLLLYARSGIFVSDTCFHIKTGEWVVKNKAFPKYDSFSLLSSSIKLNFIAHEWLFGVMMYLVDCVFSLRGLLIVTFLVVFSSYLYAIFKSGAKVPALVVSCLFLFFNFIKRIECRPDAFSAILLVIMGYTYLYENKKLKRYLIVILSMIFMANFHGGHSSMAIVQIVWFCLCKCYISKKANKDDIILALSTIIASFINPYGIMVHKYVLVVSDSITEFNSEYISFSFTSIAQLGVVLIVFILSILGYLNSKEKNKLDLLIMFMYLAMLLYYQRTINIFNYAFIIYMSKYLSWVFTKKKVILFSFAITNIASIFLAVLVISNSKLPNKTTEELIREDIIGENILNELGDSRYYNSMMSGGFFIYLDMKPLIDGRNDVYTKEFGNPDLFATSVKATYSEVLMYNLTTKYDLTYLVLENNSLTSQIFYTSNLWEVVQKSDNFILFKRVGF